MARESRKRNKKRFAVGRIFATILGVLLLFGAVSAGRLVIPSNQLFQLNVGAYSVGVSCSPYANACNSLCCNMPTGSDNCTTYGTCTNFEVACTNMGRNWCFSDQGYKYTCCNPGYVCGSQNIGCYYSAPPQGGCPTGYHLNEQVQNECRNPNTCYNGYLPCDGGDQCFVDMVQSNVTCSPPPNGLECTYKVCDKNCTPVDGVWSGWSACVSGVQTRTCDNPAPSCGGADCIGLSTQSCNSITLTPATKTVNVGSTTTSPFEATYTGTLPHHVHFSSGGISKFTVVTPQDNSFPFQTNITGVSATTGTSITATSHTASHVVLATATAATVIVPVPTITLSPSTQSVIVGQTSSLPFTATANNLSPTSVRFYRTNNRITIGTPTDSSPPLFQTYVRGVTAGTSAIRASAYVGNTNVVTSVWYPVTVSASPWWQVSNSDIQTRGPLRSTVPSGSFFNVPPTGWPTGYPGVTAYSSTTNLTTANVAASLTRKWLANSAATNSKVFNYAYFAGQIPTDVSPTTVSSANIVNALTTSTTVFNKYGYYWLKFPTTGTLTIPAVNMGTRKVILLAPNANVNFTGNVTLNDGVGFFMVIAGKTGAANTYGNITATAKAASDTTLEGIYVADSTFNVGASTNRRLLVRGSVVGNGGVNLAGRTYNTVAANPAIRFEYAPDQIWLFPGKLGSRKINWNEVAP